MIALEPNSLHESNDCISVYPRETLHASDCVTLNKELEDCLLSFLIKPVHRFHLDIYAVEPIFGLD